MTKITKISILTGVVLIALGLGFYIGTGRSSWTALIPALFFGLPIFLCGLLASNEKRRMMAAHIAVLFAALGVLGGFGMGIPKVLKNGFEPASLAQLIMAVICVVYAVACVRSFIAARKG